MTTLLDNAMHRHVHADDIYNSAKDRASMIQYAYMEKTSTKRLHLSSDELEDCPYHHIKPWQLGNHDLYKDSDGNDIARPRDFLSAFADAMLFCYGFTVFCPECAKKSPTPDKHNKFGYGFCSQRSLAQAKRNWNNAVCRFARRSIKAVLEGKQV